MNERFPRKSFIQRSEVCSGSLSTNARRGDGKRRITKMKFRDEPRFAGKTLFRFESPRVSFDAIEMILFIRRLRIHRFPLERRGQRKIDTRNVPPNNRVISCVRAARTERESLAARMCACRCARIDAIRQMKTANRKVTRLLSHMKAERSPVCRST